MIDKAADAILSQGGIWAALFIFSVAGGAYLYKQLVSCWSDRLAETKALAEVVHANSTVLAAMTAAFDARTRAVEASARAQEMLAGEVTRLRDEVVRRNGAPL